MWILWFLSAFAFAGTSHLPPSLVDAPGKGQVLTNCQTCHSLEYIPMNAGFLGKNGWESEVKKMIHAYGAPIPEADVPVLVKYLSQNY
jgi:hypothetical protein